MDTLYHYCTTQAFHSIVENRAIWLSSLKLSNDTTEGTLVLDALTHLAKRDNLDSAAISRVQEAVVHLQDEVDGLGLCLSENGDLLSQWRSPYADDGTGVAVGFSRAYLQSLAASFYEYGWSFGKVVYTDTDTDTDTEHDAELESTYDQIKRLIEAGAYQGKSDFGLEDEKLSDALH